jgi:putative ABC transport system permease protein
MDLRFTFRQLAKNPAFALIAILTLALGIGANTAIFSFVNAWIIRPLPFPNPESLVVVFETEKKSGSPSAVAPADWKDWREKSEVFEDLATVSGGSFNLTGNDEPQRIAGYSVSANFFRALGVKPALGREFREGESDVVILAHFLWRDRFSSDPNILGRKITLDGAAVTIVGVMPETFQYIPMGLADLFAPLQMTPTWLATRNIRFLHVVGRLKPGMDARRAAAAMAAFQDTLAREYAATNSNRGVLVRSLQEEVDQQSGNGAVKIVFATVWFVLLMACVNVANLIMSRATSRRKEMAVRLAVGAGRWRLIRQLLGETVVLFVAGAAGGVLFARWGVAYLLHAIPARSLPYLPNFGRVDVDWKVLLFALGIALSTGLLFGLAPALEGTRVDLNTVLKDAATRGSGSLGGTRFRKILVAAEMALAVVVVVCGALLANSFVRMMRVDPGFDGAHVLVAEMQLPPRYKTPASIQQFYDGVIERLRPIPGVERAAAAMYTPFSDGGDVAALVIEGRPATPPGQGPVARRNWITPDYLEAMNIPLIAGRTISRQDSADAPLAVVVNETIVKRYFQGENPVGKRVRLSSRNPAWFTIVGVVKDIKYYNLAAPPENQTYLAFEQSPKAEMHLVIRTPSNAAALAQAIRAAVRAGDPNQPVSRIMTIAERIDEQVAGDRILTQVSGFFGALALFLAAIGLYGVIAYSVSQRTQEIGVRMALGAQRGDVLRLIIGQGMFLVVGGILVGVVGAVFMAKLLANFLYGITPSDPVTFVTTLAVLGAVAMGACVIPAQRATKIDPIVALRYE